MSVIQVNGWKTQIIQGARTLEEAISKFSFINAKSATDIFSSGESKIQELMGVGSIYDIERNDAGEYDLWILATGIGKHASQRYLQTRIGKNRGPNFASLHEPEKIVERAISDITFTYKIVNSAAEQLMRDSKKDPVLKVLYQIGK